MKIPRMIFLASTVYKKYRIAYKCCSYLISILRVHGAPRSTKLTNDPPEQLPQKSVCQGSVHHMHDMLDHLKHDRAKIPASAAFGIYGFWIEHLVQSSDVFWGRIRTLVVKCCEVFLHPWVSNVSNVSDSIAKEESQSDLAALDASKTNSDPQVA